MRRVSAVIPVLDERDLIKGLIESVTAAGADEIVVADGGSTDGTVEAAARWAKVVHAPRGRAVQMNAGAKTATGDVLLFLHADVRLRPGAIDAVRRGLDDPAVVGGNFHIRFDGGDRVAAIFGWINAVRCRFGIFYGDSGIFVRREVFERLGGYSPWPIMEDYEFARRLRRTGAVAFLEEPIFVSDRRWRKAGLLRTMWWWFWIQALYLAGVHPGKLARWYRDVR